MQQAQAATLFVLRRCLRNIVPYLLVGCVGIFGCDSSDVAHDAFLLHRESVDFLGEDRWLVHIQHLDDDLSI